LEQPARGSPGTFGSRVRRCRIANPLGVHHAAFPYLNCGPEEHR
jgi:hypothetical protein